MFFVSWTRIVRQRNPRTNRLLQILSSLGIFPPPTDLLMAATCIWTFSSRVCFGRSASDINSLYSFLFFLLRFFLCLQGKAVEITVQLWRRFFKLVRRAASVRSDDESCNGGVSRVMTLVSLFVGILLVLAQLELWCEGRVATGMVGGEETATAIATLELPRDWKQVLAASARRDTGENEAFGTFDGTSGCAMLELSARMPKRVEGVEAEVRQVSERAGVHPLGVPVSPVVCLRDRRMAFCISSSM